MDRCVLDDCEQVASRPPWQGNEIPSNAFTGMLSAMRMPDNERLNTTRSR
jgi:hypothetical protein